MNKIRITGLCSNEIREDLRFAVSKLETKGRDGIVSVLV